MTTAGLGAGAAFSASAPMSPCGFSVALAHGRVARGEFALAPGQEPAELDFYIPLVSGLKWHYSKRNVISASILSLDCPFDLPSERKHCLSIARLSSRARAGEELERGEGRRRTFTTFSPAGCPALQRCLLCAPPVQRKMLCCLG